MKYDSERRSIDRVFPLVFRGNPEIDKKIKLIDKYCCCVLFFFFNFIENIRNLEMCFK